MIDVKFDFCHFKPAIFDMVSILKTFFFSKLKNIRKWKRNIEIWFFLLYKAHSFNFKQTKPKGGKSTYFKHYEKGDTEQCGPRSVTRSLLWRQIMENTILPLIVIRLNICVGFGGNIFISFFLLFFPQKHTICIYTVCTDCPVSLYMQYSFIVHTC